MDANAYEIEYQVQSTHWWFVVRRKLFSRLINKYKINHDSNVLDIGVSTGTNLKMLEELGFTNVTGLDMSLDAIKFCAKKGFNSVKQGDVCQIPYDDDSLDLILATDIIEHVTDDDKALAEIYRVLKPGGKVIITVPCFQSLWGPQDELSHHVRRYRKKELLAKINRVNFQVKEQYYFNYLLFLPIFLARKLLNRFSKKTVGENTINTNFMNKLFTLIFTVDTSSASILHPPFGVSALAICQK